MPPNSGMIAGLNCETLKKMLNLIEAAIIVKAGHYCIKSRVVNHTVCTAVTTSMYVAFSSNRKDNHLYVLFTI